MHTPWWQCFSPLPGVHLYMKSTCLGKGIPMGWTKARVRKHVYALYIIPRQLICYCRGIYSCWHFLEQENSSREPWSNRENANMDTCFCINIWDVLGWITNHRYFCLHMLESILLISLCPNGHTVYQCTQGEGEEDCNHGICICSPRVIALIHGINFCNKGWYSTKTP